MVRAWGSLDVEVHGSGVRKDACVGCNGLGCIRACIRVCVV